MKREARAADYGGLRLEAYRLQGIAQPFPTHFHDYYVIGLVERGSRRLCCGRREYGLDAGGLLLLNPGDSHGCVQRGGDGLDYRGLNLPIETVEALAAPGAPHRFAAPVFRDGEAACCLRALHEGILEGFSPFEGEELLRCLLSLLLPGDGRAPERDVRLHRTEVERACALMRARYAERLSLEDLCRHTGLSASTLLRAFAGEKGMTPYRYLEAVRIGEAKKLLERGAAPAEAALQTGFTDQSHFTNYFTRFIGLTPGAYRKLCAGGGARKGETTLE